MADGSLVNYITGIPIEQGQPPNSANNLQGILSALKGGSGANAMNPNQNPQNTGGLGPGLQSLGKGIAAGSGMNALEDNAGNTLAPGGNMSPLDSYVNEQGDLMSGGLVTPG